MDSPATAGTPAILALKRVFNAPIEQVFEAWTSAKILAHWFGPEGFIVKTAEVDLQVGGKYLIILQPPAGEAIRHFGEYLVIAPPSRLVFTWVLQNQICQGSVNQCAETLVTLDFKRVGRATEIQLSHERLPNKEAYDGHAFGWASSFDCLETYLISLEDTE